MYNFPVIKNRVSGTCIGTLAPILGQKTAAHTAPPQHLKDRCLCYVPWQALVGLLRIIMRHDGRHVEGRAKEL